ncbi:P2X purinoceptor 1 [Platysternon megacephalum]|uniref:P2X purinoceptor 1 n=1 Tax=Platysternon megacephalum TaxID=55544 RepID=A0A4D9EYQ0_9SAUR|nr:P2X purinoceptor 1 [Platysternon megacephalum]
MVATYMEFGGRSPDCRREQFGGGTRMSVCVHIARMLAAVAASLQMVLLMKSQFSFTSLELFHVITQRAVTKHLLPYFPSFYRETKPPQLVLWYYSPVLKSGLLT